MAPKKGSVSDPFSPGEVAECVRRYEAGGSTTSIAAALGRSESGVKLVLRRSGVMLRKPTDHMKRHPVRQDAFRDAESNPLAAYWVGFLLADGNVQRPESEPKRQPSIALDLAVKDRGHVEAFARFLGLPADAVVAHKQGKAVRIRVRSAAVAEDLARYGVTPAKSLTALPSRLLVRNRHFWRGVFDGDGCIHIGRVKNKHQLCERVAASLVGSQGVVEAFQAFVLAHCSGCQIAVAKHPRHNYWTWATVGRYAAEILRILYAASPISLPRKQALADAVAADFDYNGYRILHTDEGPEAKYPRGMRFIEYQGERKPLAEWARLKGMRSITLAARLRYGWTVEEAMETPLRQKGG